MKDRKFTSIVALDDPLITPFKKREGKTLRQWYRFQRDWHLRIIDSECVGIEFIVKKGSESNSASVPRGLRWIVSPHSVIEEAFFHDAAYQDGKIFTRSEADQLFMLAMEQWSEYTAWRRGLGFLAVRLFGKSCYRNPDKR